MGLNQGFETYRQKSREYVTPAPVVNDDGTENMSSIQKEITAIKDFWEANRPLLLILYYLSLKYVYVFAYYPSECRFSPIFLDKNAHIQACIL